MQLQSINCAYVNRRSCNSSEQNEPMPLVINLSYLCYNSVLSFLFI